MAEESWETLYSNFQANDPNDAQGWIISNNNNGIIFSTCNVLLCLEDIIYLELIQKYQGYLICLLIIKSKLLCNSGSISSPKYRIDSLDNEFGYVVTEDAYWLKSYIFWEGSQLCGAGYNWYEQNEPITFVMNHSSESLFFIATSNLKKPAYDVEYFQYKRKVGDLEIYFVKIIISIIVFIGLVFYLCDINQQNLQDG